jgi:serine/threonine protein kinase
VTVRETLVGRYDLLDVLGRGGMGVVYRARDRMLDRVVAVKVLPGETADDPSTVARFEREARAVAALSDANVVAVFDIGRDRETRFIVMECVPGRSLAQLVRAEGRLPVARAVGIAAQVASALAAAHRAGLVHRDIKPANVMVDDAGAVKVLDFGIVRGLASTSLTQTAIVLGSAPYMAPEVARGGQADARSDIYSLGCLLYELLTGRPPFTGELAAAIMHQHNLSSPRPPRELGPDTPPALDALVMRMLAKRPSARPQTADEVVSALGAASRDPAVPALRWGRGAQIWTAGLALLAVAVLALVLLGSSSGGSQRAARQTTAATKPQARHPNGTSSTRAASTRPSASSPDSRPTTVPAAAGALASLITQDLQSGGIDQHGRDVLSRLQDILGSYEQGRAGDALHKLDDLTGYVGDLSAHGDIRAAALQGIGVAIGDLRTAIARAAPVAPSTPAGAAATPPPTGKTGKASKPGKPGKPPKGPGHGEGHGHGGGD